jgi:hypothetical protein
LDVAANDRDASAQSAIAHFLMFDLFMSPSLNAGDSIGERATVTLSSLSA